MLAEVVSRRDLSRLESDSGDSIVAVPLAARVADQFPAVEESLALVLLTAGARQRHSCRERVL